MGRVEGKQIYGHKFNRQKPILNYMVDFYCKSLGLVLEVDDDSHQHKFKLDKKRDKELNDLGLTVLRFDDRDVRTSMLNVLAEIEQFINESNE